MPTVPYTESLKSMADRNPDIAYEMLEAALNAMLSGDLDEGRLHLRDYIHATIGFPELARRMNKIDKSLLRALGPKGNPTVTNMFEMIRVASDAQNIKVSAHVKPAGRSAAPVPV